jgi:glycosyltransferase involved in cell wall biosynthesis
MTTVIQCVNNMDLGGLEQLVLALAPKLIQRGFPTVICCVEDRGMLADQAERQGIEVCALQMERRGKCRALRRLCDLLAQYHPNVIHSHNFKPFYYASLARMLGAADGHVHTRHGAFIRYHRAPWRYRLLRRWVDELVTVSASGREELARLAGLPSSTIGVLPNGVDTDRFQPAPDKTAVRRELRLPESSLAVVTVARLAPEKDLETLLRAFAIVTRTHPTTELWVVGYGPEQQCLQALTRELCLETRTHFLGLRDDVDKILRAADVFALSSLSEGLSVALIEAASCGLPIVATDVGGNAEVVNPPAGGVLVKPRDPEALAAALVKLLSDEDLRRRMGGAARQHALAQFSVEQMVNRYISLYETALHTSSGRLRTA